MARLSQAVLVGVNSPDWLAAAWHAQSQLSDQPQYEVSKVFHASLLATIAVKKLHSRHEQCHCSPLMGFRMVQAQCDADFSFASSARVVCLGISIGSWLHLPHVHQPQTGTDWQSDQLCCRGLQR